MASAQEVPNVQFYTNSPAMVGDTPTFELTSRDELEDVTITIRRGSDRFEDTFSSVRPGNSANVEFETPLGEYEWTAEISGDWDGEPFNMSIDFDFDLTEGLEISVPLDSVDLEGHSLDVVLSRPAALVEYDIIGDTGNSLGGGSIEFSGEQPGTDLTINWEQREGTILIMTLRGHDVDGFWAEMELIPWSVEIPHEEVVFSTGSAVVEESETHKIDDAYGQLLEAVELYGDFVQINLYVAGYTDTVGSHSDNQDLSDRRARSIAEAFRQRGFSFPIYYQGFGEEALAVATPDNTDELRNRRALYILAAQPPLPSSQIPRGRWQEID